MSVVAEFYKTIGTWMHPIAFVSVVVVAVVAERIYFLWFRYNLNSSQLHGSDSKADHGEQRGPSDQALQR